MGRSKKSKSTSGYDTDAGSSVISELSNGSTPSKSSGFRLGAFGRKKKGPDAGGTASVGSASTMRIDGIGDPLALFAPSSSGGSSAGILAPFLILAIAVIFLSKKKRVAPATRRKSPLETNKYFGGNILTRSRWFRGLVKKAFTAIDTGKTGEVSKSDLYVGLLSIHITLARYAGPAACYPPPQEVSDQLFEAADVDNSGTVDVWEFENIAVILCTQILSRMLVYYGVLILFVPRLSREVIDAVPHIGRDSWLEMAAEQTISLAIFFGAVPLLWSAIDSSAHSSIKNSNNGSEKKSD